MSIASLVEANLCVADMEDFEQTVGVGLLETLEGLRTDEMPKPAVLAGLIWIAKRHEDANFTIEDARRVPISELVVDKRTNPTRAARPKSSKTTKKPVKKSASKRS